jgi:hypothetical protein
LLKDYELVHYHSGKGNAIADALSHKAHCNYFPAVRLTRKESRTRVLPKLLMFACFGEDAERTQSKGRLFP